MGITHYPLPQKKGKSPLSLFGGIFGVILHDFIKQNHHKKQSNRYPFFLIVVNYPILSLNDHILYFQMCFQHFSFFQKYRTIYQKRVTFCNFWNRSSNRNDCFWFLELFSIIYQAHSIRSYVQNVFFRTYLFQNRFFIITYLLCLFLILFGSSVISTDIQKGIKTNLLG